MPHAKIQWTGQSATRRNGAESLTMQIVRRLQEAIESGRLGRDALLPSSRSLARGLGVSRNTVLTAYDELKSRGLIRGQRGAGMRVAAAPGVEWFDLQRVLREAHYPARTLTLLDPDGNPISLNF